MNKYFIVYRCQFEPISENFCPRTTEITRDKISSLGDIRAIEKELTDQLHMSVVDAYGQAIVLSWQKFE